MGRPHLTFEQILGALAFDAQAFGTHVPGPACALALTLCGGPTAVVPEGEICEQCTAALVAQIEAGLGLTDEACSHCGASPARRTTGDYFICRDCGHKALETVRAWYRRTRPAARKKGRATATRRKDE